MKKRRTDDEVSRLPKDADRDLIKELTVADICRKISVAETTYYRWSRRHDPVQFDTARRCRQLESEVEQIKPLVAELMLDKQMLQEVAKKSGEPRAVAAVDFPSETFKVSERRAGRVMGRSRSTLRHRLYS